MVQLRMEGVSAAYSITLGPAPWFRVAGNFIRQGPRGTIVATYYNHQWEVQSRFFTRFECRDPLLIHFEDAAGGSTEDYGAFSHFQAADGVLYADNKLFAKFIEESQLWHCYVTENFWPVLVFKPAGQMV